MAITFHLEEHFAAPPERVFGALTDLDAAADWMPGLARIERLTAGGFGVGTQWREVRRSYDREASDVFEVRQVEPGRRLELHVDGTKGTSRRGSYTFVYTLQPAGNGTRLTVTGEMSELGAVGVRIGRLYAGTFRSAILRDLRALREFLGRPGVPA